MHGLLFPWSALILLMYARPIFCNEVLLASGWDYMATMMHDAKRNAAFRQAIAETVKPGDLVLDVGAGLGLLSMFASMNGGNVTAVECVEETYQVLNHVLRDNGFDGNISTRNVHSDSLGLRDFGRPIDVLISETLDSKLIGEQFIHSLNRLRSNGVLDDNTVVIPRFATVRFAVVQNLLTPSPTLIEGVDFNFLIASTALGNKLLPSGMEPQYVRLLSPTINGFAYDFSRPGSRKAHRVANLTFSFVASGTPHGVLIWFDAQLNPEGTASVSNDPFDSKSHWAPYFMPFIDDYTRVSTGSLVTMMVATDDSEYIFQFINEHAKSVVYASSDCTAVTQLFQLTEQREVFLVEIYPFKSSVFFAKELGDRFQIRDTDDTNRSVPFLFESVSISKNAYGEIDLSILGCTRT